MKAKRRITKTFDDFRADYKYKLQRHVNFGFLEWFGCKGWWVTDSTTVHRSIMKSWSSHYDIDITEI